MNSTTSIAVIVVVFILAIMLHGVAENDSEGQATVAVAQACAKIGKKVEVHKTSSAFTAKCVEP